MIHFCSRSADADADAVDANTGCSSRCFCDPDADGRNICCTSVTSEGQCSSYIGKTLQTRRNLLKCLSCSDLFAGGRSSDLDCGGLASGSFCDVNAPSIMASTAIVFQEPTVFDKSD